jgi:hypothetical protein
MPGPRSDHPQPSHQRGGPDRPPRTRSHLAPARGLAPRAGMAQPLRSRLRAASPGGLTSPHRSTRPPRPQRPPPSQPSQEQGQAAEQSAARTRCPGTGHEHHRQTATQKMITRIYAVDRGLARAARAPRQSSPWDTRPRTGNQAARGQTASPAQTRRNCRARPRCRRAGICRLPLSPPGPAPCAREPDARLDREGTGPTVCGGCAARSCRRALRTAGGLPRAVVNHPRARPAARAAD